MAMALDKYYRIGRLGAGITYYPYQITFGISLRYFPSIFSPTIRIHFLCFKVWLIFNLKEILTGG